METPEALKAKIATFRAEIAEIERKIQSFLPDSIPAKGMRFGFKVLPHGYLDKQEYHKQLNGLKSELQWVSQAAPDRTADAKNRILEFISTNAWVDSKQLHQKIDPLLDEKLELLWKIQEFELSPGGVNNGSHGEHDLPGQGQRDLGALDPPEPPDL